MKKLFKKFSDTFIAGLIFLLPLLILFVLLSKLFQFLTGFTTKIAAVFGLKSIVGISGGTVVSAISIIVLCIICGYLVRIAVFKSVSSWVDKQMAAHIPGYSVYHEMAISKLEDKEEALPYESAAWLLMDGAQQPAFLMNTMADGRLVIFVPTAGNIKEGSLFVLPAEKVLLCKNVDMKKFRLAIRNLGIGLSEV